MSLSPHEWVGPPGLSGNGKGKGGKGDGKGKVNVSFYYGEGKGGKCDDWMTTVGNEAFRGVADAMAGAIGRVMKAAYFQGHADGVADEREGLTEGKGKKGRHKGKEKEPKEETTAPGESSSSGSHNKRHANSPAEGDESGSKAARSDTRDRQDGDGGQYEENDGYESQYSLDSETRDGLNWD